MKLIGSYVKQSETNSKRPHRKPFNEVLTGIYRKKMLDSPSLVTKSSPTLTSLTKPKTQKSSSWRSPEKVMSQMPQRKDLHIFCYHDFSLCSLYNTQSKIIFHSSLFAPFVHYQGLLTRIILLAGHSATRLVDFITLTLNFGLNLATVNLIVPVWYGSAAYQARQHIRLVWSRHGYTNKYI